MPMKRLLYILPLILFQFSTNAAVGDTTWVQAHSDIWLGASPANHDTTIQFPDGTKSYRKVFMIFTLGKYQCPGTPQYCGDWDYTVQNFIMTPGGDTFETARLITPYANATYPRTPWSWKERYVYDVTDFYLYLKDSATARIHYSGYSGGFTANVKFAFIEGTPPRNVVDAERLWHGSFGFGNTNSIDTKIQAVNTNAPTGTDFTEMKFIISGHGSDNNYCSEFCKKYYQVMLNSSMTEQKDIWRADCGYNRIYPQSGTWVYDRANWCPGDVIHTNIHKLQGITGGNNYDVDVDFEPYTGNGGASYIIEGSLFYYGPFNNSLDASLEDIIAPNNHEMYFRYNAKSGRPIVKIKNTGSTTITTLSFTYGMTGGTEYYYDWSGSIAPLEDANIELPEFWDLRIATGANNSFTAKISRVNGQADNDASNDKLSSWFTAAPNWPMDIVLRLKTNSGSFNGEAETSWWLISADNDTVARRAHNALNTTYNDTIHLGPSYYRLVVKDEGCDGLYWWANTTQGTGTLTAKSSTGLTLNLPGYFGGDFGCGFTQYFNTNWPSSISDNDIPPAELELFPNPANNHVKLFINGVKDTKGTISIIDPLGRTVIQQNCRYTEETINTESLSAGVYTVIFSNSTKTEKLQSRLVIVK
jgi:hypothetical protein